MTGTPQLLTAGVLVAAGASVALGDVQTADEVRAVVAEVLADAETRSSLLQSGGSVGHDAASGFFIRDASGNNTLNVRGYTQFRYTLNFRDDEDGTVDDFEGGFENRRTRLEFSGNVVMPNLAYMIAGDFNDDDAGGTFTLQDAYFGYAFGDSGWGLYAGQVRFPLLWEDTIADFGGLAADESIVNAVFNPGRVQGIWAHYSGEEWRGWFAFDDGAASANTSWDAPNADWALTARVEWMFSGDNWAQFNTFSGMPDDEFHAKLGLGGHIQDGPDVPGDNGPFVALYTADLQFKGDGWNIFGAFIGRHVNPDTSGDPTLDDFAVVAQGGWFIPETDWELFGRYDAIFPDDDYLNSDSFTTLTVGTNWFWAGQAARFTLDLQYFFDDTEGTDIVQNLATSTSQFGLRPSADSGQIALRAQFQLIF